MHRVGAALSGDTTGTGRWQMTDAASPMERSRSAEGSEANGATRARNEREILAAAEKVFAAHGYRGASVQAIAEAAGLPKSNVLYYMAASAGSMCACWSG